MPDARDPGPLSDRARHYRELAKDFLKRAAETPPGQTRDGYVHFALGYATLADDCENLLASQGSDDRESLPEASPPSLSPEAGETGQPDLTRIAAPFA